VRQSVKGALDGVARHLQRLRDVTGARPQGIVLAALDLGGHIEGKAKLGFFEGGGQIGEGGEGAFAVGGGLCCASDNGYYVNYGQRSASHASPSTKKWPALELQLQEQA
jgi:hypothetical protein